MSWAFGTRPAKQDVKASKEDTKKPETSEQAIEKLQGFHQLVKVFRFCRTNMLPKNILLLTYKGAVSHVQDALERAYQQDVSNQTEEARKSYHFAVKAINEGLALKVPSAWLPGTNVSKLRCNLNNWLQLAVDRYCSSTASQLHVKCMLQTSM